MIVPEALEFDRVRAMVAAEACSEATEARIMSEAPSNEEARIVETLAVVAEMVRLLDDGKAGPSARAPDLSAALSALRVEGGQLELTQLGAVVQVAALRNDYVSWLTDDDVPELLSGLVSGFDAPTELMGEATRHFTPSGEVIENSIPELARIRTLIAENYRTLQREASRQIREGGNKFRESGATIRDGRTVLPLAANFRGQVNGVVHEMSGSGSTVFVEPPELVALNNERVALENEIHMIVRALVRRLSGALRDELPRLTEMHDHLVLVDARYARARYSRSIDGTRPATGASIHLKGARHVLLGKGCIPVEIDFPGDTRVLMVSGPNTGGKTVLLKTLGLIAAMHQFGLFVPVEEGSVLPVFDFIGVDVGDAQSIDQSLSTFSAHLRKLAQVMEHATERSLVLLDELGTGTDPEEAAALSTAYVDELLSKGPCALITTHQGVLKHYGYTHDRVENASMEYDAVNHRPTYRVIPGTPGSSYAIDTAEQQGFPSAIVEAAREYARGTHTNVAEVIARLSEQERQLTKKTNLVEQERRELEETRARLEERERTLAEQELEIRRDGLRDLRNVAHEARRSVENAVRLVREARPTERNAAAERDARGEVSAVEERIRVEEKRIEELSARSAHGDDVGVSGPIGEGDLVRHRTSNREGEVRRIRGKRAEVQFGAVRMSVPLSDLVRRRAGSDQIGVSIDAPRPSGTYALQIDLRGMRLEEALMELERRLDAAIASGQASLSVVHGTGTGVLQRGVRDALRAHPSVRSFDYAHPDQGGHGCTQVLLK